MWFSLYIYVCVCVAIKIDVCNLSTYLNRTLMFEWCMDKCRSKNGHQKHMCLEEIGLHV